MTVPKLDDLTGRTFGRLIVLGICRKTTARKILWRCKCTCGNEAIVFAEHLRTGHTSSCGCYRSEATTISKLVHGHNRKGLTTQEYRVWADMIQRCVNINNPRYKDYGGRGIKVCTRWRYGNSIKSGFVLFLEDMGTIPDKKYVIDRNNNNGDYEPNNCSWITKKESANNTRRNINIEYLGETKTLKEWAISIGINYHTLFRRVSTQGWSVEKAFTKPVAANYQGRFK